MSEHDTTAAQVGDEWLRVIRDTSTMELVQLSHELRRTQPADRAHLNAVLDEIKRRHDALRRDGGATR